VFLFNAFEAEAVPTIALDSIFFCEIRPFDDIAALEIWTPLDVFIVICELLAVPL
jgi:hypothetical protein